MILYIQSCAVTLTRITKIDYRQEFMEFYIKCLVRGLSWWPRGKELACQGRRHGFDLGRSHMQWSMKPVDTTLEPVL